MVGKGHSFLESAHVPQHDSPVMRSRGEDLAAGLHGQRFYEVQMCFFIGDNGCDLILDEILL